MTTTIFKKTVEVYPEISFITFPLRTNGIRMPVRRVITAVLDKVENV